MQNLPSTFYVLSTVSGVEYASMKHFQIPTFTEDPRREQGPMTTKREDANLGLGKGLRSCTSNKIPSETTSPLLEKVT